MRSYLRWFELESTQITIPVNETNAGLSNYSVGSDDVVVTVNRTITTLKVGSINIRNR